MKDLAIKKLYYSIGEVSQITSVKAYVLRFWETEFKELKPTKNRSGKRVYRRSDVQLVLLISKLLYVDKFTIEGARQQLRRTDNTSIEGKNNLGHKNLIQQLRNDLTDILNIIESQIGA